MLEELDKARDMIDRSQALVILELMKQSKIPSWALRELDFELIRLAAR